MKCINNTEQNISLGSTMDFTTCIPNCDSKTHHKSALALLSPGPALALKPCA